MATAFLERLSWPPTKRYSPLVYVLQRQSAVGPQLPLGTEAMRCLHQRNQQSGADGADRGNLPQ